MAHAVEVFVGGCPLCEETRVAVEVGMCAGCELRVHDLTGEDPEAHRRAEALGVRAVPSVVVDGRIKVEGKPAFPWLCGEEFYAWLLEHHPLRPPPRRREGWTAEGGTF